jgi:hypothetical protein
MTPPPRPWVTAYRRRRTMRTARCGEVLPTGHRCRWPVQPGTTTCTLHAADGQPPTTTTP